MTRAIRARAGALSAILAAAFLVSAAPAGALDDLAPGTVTAVIDGKTLTFSGAAGLVERRGGIVRFTIALADRGKRVELTISGQCDELEPGVEARLTAEYNEVMMIYKTARGGFTIMPAVTMAKDSGHRYVPERVRGDGRRVHDGRGGKQGPEWASMGRAERIASGKGVIRNRRMEGSALYLAVTPAGSGGSFTELRGTFSGTAKSGAGRHGGGRMITIRDGRFRVAVGGGK